MSYNKWAEACILCGTSTSTSSTQLPNKDQVKLTEAFCELYEIDNQLEEVWNTVQFAFYCSNCRAELHFIHEFTTLRQSQEVGGQENNNDSIGKLRSRLKIIQLQQQEKLQKFLDTLISSGTGDQEDETDHDQIWGEIMKQKQLLLCMQLHNKNYRDIEGAATKSVVTDADAVNAPNFGLNSDPDSSWNDIPDEEQGASYPADRDNRISNSLELDLDVDVDVDVKPEIPQDIDPAAAAGMKFIGVESLNNNSGGEALSCTWTDCVNEFKTDKERVEHVKRFHEGFKKPFPCETCGKSTHSYNRYLDHQNIHLGLTPYDCLAPGCKRFFFTFDQLKDHLRGAKHGKKLGIEQNQKHSKKKKTCVKSHESIPKIPLNFAELKRLHNLKELSINLQNINIESKNSTPSKKNEQRTRSGRLLKKTIKAQEIITVGDKEPNKSNKTAGDGDELFDGDDMKNCRDYHSNVSVVNSATGSESDHEMVEIKLVNGDAHVPISISDSDSDTVSHKYQDDDDDDDNDDGEDEETRAEFERLYSSNEFTISLEVTADSPPKTPWMHSSIEKSRLIAQNSTAKCQAQKRKKAVGKIHNEGDSDSCSNSTNTNSSIESSDSDSDSELRTKSETESDKPSKKPAKKPKLQSELKYPCDSCKKICSSQELLDQHQNIHNGLRPFSCTESNCTHASATEAGLQKHKQRCHGFRQFQCEACGKLFYDITAYRKHQLAHKIQRLNRHRDDKVSVRDRDPDQDEFEGGDGDGEFSELKCAICSKYFVSRYHLKRHKINSNCNKEGRPSFKCGQCSKTYTSESHLKEHQLSHDESYVQENLSCPTCHKSFLNKRNLKFHLLAVHTKEFKFKCEFVNCNFGTNKAPRLKIHMDHVHSEVRPFKCDSCTKSFKSSESLKLHKKQVHPVSKDHICTICGLALATKATLRQHEARHNDPNKAGNEFFSGTCHLCGAIFYKEKDLQLHEIGHYGDRDSTFETVPKDNVPFLCYYCKESFSSRSTMQLHQRRIHFEKFEFQCEQCNYGAPTSSAMEQHVSSSHSSARPFKCLICESSFRTQADLKKHMKSTHPVSKDHICLECGKAFSLKSKLSEHEFKAHKKPYPKKSAVTSASAGQSNKKAVTEAKSANRVRCELCQQNFLHVTNLKKHNLKVHGPIRSSDGDGDEYEKDGYNCEHCSSTFTMRRNLVSHMKSHDENYVQNFLTCQICSRVYTTEQGLRRHKDKDKCSLKDNKDLINS